MANESVWSVPPLGPTPEPLAEPEAEPVDPPEDPPEDPPDEPPQPFGGMTQRLVVLWQSLPAEQPFAWHPELPGVQDLQSLGVPGGSYWLQSVVAAG
jgi:hypothetical protein